MKKLIVITAGIFAAASVGAGELVNYKLEMVKSGVWHRQIEVSATLGKPSIYYDATASSGEAQNVVEGTAARLFPVMVESDGAVLTEVKYSIRDSGSAVEGTHLVKIKPGETKQLFASSSPEEVIQLTLSK